MPPSEAGEPNQGQKSRSRWVAIGAVLGALGVALGAFGAHALRDRLEGETLAVFETAARYHMIHALALVAIGLAKTHRPRARLGPAGWLMLIGILIFSGSLYLLAITGLRWLGAITPVGGVSLIAGWLWLAIAAWRARDGYERCNRADG